MPSMASLIMTVATALCRRGFAWQRPDRAGRLQCKFFLTRCLNFYNFCLDRKD
jgi:hypothetical protein